MEIEKTKELTLEDLSRITWDYSFENFIGVYHEKPIWVYMFEVKECRDINPLTV